MRNIADTGVHAKLNLCCGDDIRNGYVNVDFRRTHPNTIQADLSQLPWPFADESASEILLLDALEHFSWRLTTRILLECFRVLEPGGSLVIQVPAAEQMAHALIQEGPYFCNRCPTEMAECNVIEGGWDNLPACPKCGQSADDISQQAMQMLYGGQNYEGNWHATAFTPQSLTLKLSATGFGGFIWEEKEHQEINWAMKIRAIRGDVW